MSDVKKSGFVAIIGRPNVGKSTLLNALIGEKVAIVSPKPQTTRNRITGVLNTEDTQIIFMDTPGIHKPRTALGSFMVKSAKETIAEVDIILLVTEPDDRISKTETEIIERFKQQDIPVVLVINKIDTVEKMKILKVIDAYSKLYSFECIIPLSAKKGDGVNVLLDELMKRIPQGPQFFPDGQISDQPEKQIIAEIVREKLLLYLSEEVPHGTAVEVFTMTERDNSDVIDLNVNIYCEKDSHKGIIIGKQGAMLRKIATAARIDIERFLGCKIFLECWVKVKEDWRNNQYIMRNFGYSE